MLQLDSRKIGERVIKTLVCLKSTEGTIQLKEFMWILIVWFYVEITNKDDNVDF